MSDHTTNRCPDAETIARLSGRGLSDADRASIVNHAAACPSCHAVVEAVMDFSAPDAPVALAKDDRIDRYVIEERLGSGGMGSVYAARDPDLGRRVAVKLLHAGADDERLRREAQALARLAHPNVVVVYDVGMHAGQVFVAMALVEGCNLRQWLETPRSVPETLRHLIAAGRGLAAAHAAGLVHRDLKPDNLFVPESGEALVGDFGLASLGDLEVSASGERMDALELTQTGTLLGTPAYMAPEQAAGEATFASDQFGFCVTAWEALYGKRPYAGRTLDEIHAAVRAGMITTASRAGVPAHVTRALERGLAADPAARFRSMDALLAALTPARRRWPVVAAGGVAVTGIAIAMIAMPNPSAAIALDDPATRCSTRDQRIPGWDPSARTALAALLEKRGGDQAYVPRALAILDRYAGSWEVMRHAVCITSDPLRPEVLATRVACLDQRARALTTTLALVTTEVELPPREAWQALDELPAIDRCAGAEAAAPVRHSPALDNARLELARLAVTIDKLAWADLVALRTRIEALDDPRLLLDALLLEADTALALAEPVAGEAAARRALAIAEQLRDDLDKARAGALLTQALVKLNRQTEATGQLAAAVGSLDRGGTDRETGLVVLEARASVVRATGDLQAEIAIRQRVLAEQRRYHDDDSLAVVGAAIALGDACQRARDTCAKTAFAIVQAVGATGDEAKVQAAAMATVAAKEALEAGDFKNAIEQCLIAVRNIHDLFGDSELYMHTVTLLAQSYELAGDWAAASDQYREAARVLRTLPERTLLGDALTGIARVELERDRAQSALAPIREAHALARTSADRERTRDTAVVLARVLLATGKPSEIPPLLEPVLRAIDADPKPQSLQRAEASFTLAQALWQVGGERERSRARALIGDAIASFETSRERLAKPRATTLRRLVEAQLAAALAWQAQHR